jgi:hypothetical protein
MSEQRQAWFGLRWLEAVRAHPERTRYAVIAANALFPWTNNRTGQAVVSLERMADEQRQPIRALRRGFNELEAIGLLTRKRRRKPGSQEWDVTVYHPRLSSPEQGQEAKATGGDQPDNYSMSSELKVEKGSKRPLGRDGHDADKLYEQLVEELEIRD